MNPQGADIIGLDEGEHGVEAIRCRTRQGETFALACLVVALLLFIAAADPDNDAATAEELDR